MQEEKQMKGRANLPKNEITIREYFSGLAMQGLLSGTGNYPITSSTIMALSAMSVQTADAVLRKLEEG